MLPALLTMVGLAAAAGFAAAFAARRSERERNRLVDEIDALLPQTQCGRCTFSGCRPYATALASGEADINQCPPGGHATAAALASLLGRVAKPVDPRFGNVSTQSMVAWIDEGACIGCVKCIQACPVDAIVGASKFMHTVISAQCTGCELCVPVCPVDCIVMRPAPAAELRPGPYSVVREMTHALEM